MLFYEYNFLTVNRKIYFETDLKTKDFIYSENV